MVFDGPEGVGVAERQDFLLQVALQFGAVAELDDLLAVVLEALRRATHAERAMFALLDDDGRLERAVVHNLEWNGVLDDLPVSRSMIESVIRRNEVIYLADVANSDFSASDSVRELELRRMVGVPVGTPVIGVLYADARQLTPGTARTELLQALACLVETAVVNTRLHENQSRRSALLARMVHHLRTPLFTASTNLRVLDENHRGHNHLDLAEVGSILDDMRTALDDLDRTISDALDFARLQSPHDQAAQQVDLIERVRHHLHPFHRVARQLGVGLDLIERPGLSVSVRDSNLRITLHNLLSNAMKFAKDGSTITVQVHTRQDLGPPEVDRPPVQRSHGRRYAQISVHNVGPPIPDELVPHLFQDFTNHGGERRGIRSTGLGLAIVQECVQRMGGAVWVESTAEAGTCFSFTLPAELGWAPSPTPPVRSLV